MLVAAAEARPLRSLTDARVELGAGIVSLVGPNGVGKTNLLEALYFALTGRSFRTADRRELIPFGGQLARAEAVVRDEDGVEHRLLASVSRGDGRRHLLDGSAADSADPGPPPPSRRRLLAGSAGPDQGPTGRATRPPRRLRCRPLAFAGGVATALRAGAGAAQRAAGAARRRAGERWTGGLGRGPGRGGGGVDRSAWRGRKRAGATVRHRRQRAGAGGRCDARVRAARVRLGGGDPRGSRRKAARPTCASAAPRGAPTWTS